MDAEMEIPHPPDDDQFSGDDIAAEIFSRFQNSPEEEHHNICATAGAISQALKEQGISLTPVAYFAAAVTSFIRLSGDPSAAAGDPDVSAILYFLSLILPMVPSPVLRNKGGVFSESLTRVVGCGSLPEGGVIAALQCISHILINGDRSKSSSVSQLYGIILNCVTDNNFKVRKQAHSSLQDVLQCFQGSTALVFASEGITSSLERFLLLCGSNPPPSSVAGEEPHKGAREILYTLNALKDCIGLISIKSTNTILKYCKYLLDLRQSSVTRSITEILQSLSSKHASNFSPEVLLELLCCVARFIPEKEKSADGMASIARLLNVGMKRVFSLNRSLCIVKLPTIFTSLGEVLGSEHEEAVFAAMEAMRSLIYCCFDEGLIKQGIEQINLNHGGNRKSGPTIIEKLCAILEGFLDFRYNAVWDAAFQVISAAFDQLGRHSADLMAGILRNLADMRSLPDDKFSYNKQLHECLGSALAAMGPEKFLGLLPLNMEAEDIKDGNVWLLPILKQYTVGAELSFFSQHILTMANLLKQKSMKLERDGRIFSARNTEGFVYSLWSLFPSFCNYPIDTSTSFRGIQDIVCDTLRREAELRGIICSGLQILVQQNNSAFELRSDAHDEELSLSTRKAKEIYTTIFKRENLSALRSSSKLLSVLTDVFLESPNDSGGCLQFTIHLFASISDRATVKNFFRKNMVELLKVTKQVVKLKESEPSSMQVDNLPDEASLTRVRALRLDLAALMVPGLDKEEIDLLFSATKPALQDEEGLMQKKAYKILSLLLKESEGFLSSKLDELLQLIIKATASCHFSAKRHRLDCLYYVIVHISKEMPSEQRMGEFIRAFLTEILIALKETNKKTRNKAYDLLVEIGHACGDEDRGGKTENLHQFFNMVAGGLVSETPHMVSAAIKGLARLSYEFSDLVIAAFKLLPSSFLLLQRKNREIIKANLGLIKVLVAKSKADGLEMHLKGIIDGLLKWKDENKNHFKAKIKSLIGMLVSKCGVDAVKAVMPEEHLKLLKNIRKIKVRKERKAKSQTDNTSLCSRTSFSRHSRWNHTHIFSDFGDEDGEDASDYENGKSRIKTSFPASRASSRSGRMRKSLNRSLPEDILDHSDDDPLDLLDGRKTRSVLQSSTKLKRKVETYDDEPEVDNEGRLVVRDDQMKPKQTRISSDHDSDTRSVAASNLSGKSSLRSQKKRQKTESGWSFTGVEYASKKAGGDLKKKGKLEPYAYWPLDRKLLNRRADRKAVARKGMASIMLKKDLKRFEGRSASRALAGKLKRKGGKS